MQHSEAMAGPHAKLQTNEARRALSKAHMHAKLYVKLRGTTYFHLSSHYIIYLGFKPLENVTIYI